MLLLGLSSGIISMPAATPALNLFSFLSYIFLYTPTPLTAALLFHSITFACPLPFSRLTFPAVSSAPVPSLNTSLLSPRSSPLLAPSLYSISARSPLHCSLNNFFDPPTPLQVLLSLPCLLTPIQLTAFFPRCPFSSELSRLLFASYPPILFHPPAISLLISYCISSSFPDLLLHTPHVLYPPAYLPSLSFHSFPPGFNLEGISPSLNRTGEKTPAPLSLHLPSLLCVCLLKSALHNLQIKNLCSTNKREDPKQKVLVGGEERGIYVRIG